MSAAKPATATALREGAAAAADATPDVDLPKVEHATLAEALVAALAELTVIEAQRTASIPTKSGGSYSYKYADLGDVVKVTTRVLSRHGLAAMTPVHAHGDGLACSVIVLHTSGERETFEPLSFKHGADAQATGSAITYHRRYALLAALGLAAGDDDDGAAASKPQRSKPEPHPMRAEVAALDDGERLWADFLGRAGIEDRDADEVLRENDGWRNWLSGAIKAHQPAADGETT